MTRTAFVICSIGLVVATGVSGQTPRPAATLDDLLAEVRGLRADVNQAAGGSMRMQLLLARLQLQEQRINTVAGQLAETRRQLTSVQSGLVQPASQLKMFEEVLGDPTNPERQHVESMLGPLKAQIAQAQREEQQLRLQETELAGLLAAEQGRWMEFNGRLDDLERALPPR